MANEQHLAILKQGVEVWNEWKRKNTNVKADLSNANLSEADLFEFDLSGANLSGANLMWANLSGANLNRANLNRAYLIEAKLIVANLSSADLSIADLSGANLNGANLNGANLSRANLSKADLMWANLSSSDLSSSDLSSANLNGANLSSANLNGANLSSADLIRANLIRANLNSADLSSADLSRANLSSADLGRTILYESKVIATNFDHATLTGACIKDWSVNSETKLDKVVCEYVYLSGEYEEEEDIIKPKSRRPLAGEFLPGEFASLYKKIIENTDLTLRKNSKSANTANNQGVQFYSNQKTHIWERLTFRSKTEIKIAEALDRAEVLFLPNCLARLNTPNGRANKEADFLICYHGKWGILEVDGPYHTPERRVEEQERERIFRRHGIKVVERFDSCRCYENPDEVVEEFFKMLEIGYS
ncbi:MULTISPECIES: pentapeptide repeat-containing protein [unclassified Nodularia (in: cyanobacteria)]|uniref:pentapeptide repeat-containing protein n=1 Tax=unclassified Nodularia (in: cyanobacteria) TaxID=2656917 RepID=UPI001880D690|nr:MULTISPECIES: pentapeptide repeat-containing protein [unclassified Nodularia (in: cyanobacteria)]MBE9201414.1 pentapeptide repeat-containing protein [Nodularia sp. LEGE 06071]MCC2691502.1 pentapeptide repeat-containing protein [Nodularia sp. LEGE 04288]